MEQGYAECELIRNADGRAIDTRLIEVNHAWERLLGVPAGAARGRTSREVHPELADRWFETLDRIHAGGRPERVERELAVLGRWYEAAVYPGRGDRFTVIYDDITERKRAEAVLSESEERQAFLLRLSDALRSLDEPAAIEGEACRLLGERLATDRAYYVEVDEAAGEARVRRDHVVASVASLVGVHPTSAYGWILPVLRSGEAIAVPDVEESDLVPQDERAAMAAIAIRALVDVPLVKAGVLVGALCLTESRPRAWSRVEIELAVETAERIWAAVERARAEAALREREEVYRSLFGSIDEGFCVCEMITDAAGGPVDYRFLEVNPRFEEMTGLRDATGRTALELVPGLEPRWVETYARVGLGRATLRFEDGSDEMGRWFDVFATPVEPAGRFALVFTDITARRTAQVALEASEQSYRRAYESEHEVAGRLQESLLAGEPPELDGASVSVRYRPAAEEVRVGGDWYDGIPLSDGRIGLSLGDVVGSGIPAAVAMGRLRSAVAALAPASAGPAELLRRLVGFAERTPGARMATLCYATVDLASGDVVYACAGHPPPLVIGADGAGGYLWDGRSAPLASVSAGPDDREGRAVLGPGARLLLYSDGLVERRGELIDDGLARLARAAGERTGLELEPFCDGLLAEMFRGRSQDDDLALLCLELPAVVPPPLTLRLRAQAADLAEARHRLRDWLWQAGAEGVERDDIVLAAGEACANAVEHAYFPGGGGAIGLEARRGARGEIEVTVRDEGAWRSPAAPGPRGRGFGIMRAAMDEVAVDRGAGGTVVRMTRRVQGAR